MEEEERQCYVLVKSWAVKWNSWIWFFIVLFASFVILSKLTFLGLSVHIYKMEIVSVPSMLATVVNAVVGFISWPMTVGRMQGLLYPYIGSFMGPSHIKYDEWDTWTKYPSGLRHFLLVTSIFLANSTVSIMGTVISFLLMDIFSLVPYLGNQGFPAYHSEKINLYWFFFFSITTGC